MDSQTGLVGAKNELSDTTIVDGVGGYRTEGNLDLGNAGGVAVCVDGDRFGELGGVTGGVEVKGDSRSVVKSKYTGGDAIALFIAMAEQAVETGSR